MDIFSRYLPNWFDLNSNAGCYLLRKFSPCVNDYPLFYRIKCNGNWWKLSNFSQHITLIHTARNKKVISFLTKTADKDPYIFWLMVYITYLWYEYMLQWNKTVTCNSHQIFLSCSHCKTEQTMSLAFSLKMI